MNPAAILALLVALPAASAPATPPAAGQVEGVVAGAPSDLLALQAALGDALSAQGLTLVLTRADAIASADVTRDAGGAGDVTARFYLDLTSLPLAKLYLADGGRRRVYVRWLSLPRGLDPVALELIRFVIESSVEAIRAGRDIGVSRAEYDRSQLPPQPDGEPARSPVVPPPTPPEPPPSFVLVAAARYEATLMAPGQYQQGPGISVTARRPQLRIGVDVLARLPTTVIADAAGMRIFAGALRITAAVPVLSTARTSLLAGLGGGVDVSHIQPTTSRSDLRATPPSWATTPFVRLFAAVERDFGRLSVGGVVGVDVNLLGEHYDVVAASGRQEVFSPARLRPLVAIVIGLRR